MPFTPLSNVTIGNSQAYIISQLDWSGCAA